MPEEATEAGNAAEDRNTGLAVNIARVDKAADRKCLAVQKTHEARRRALANRRHILVFEALHPHDAVDLRLNLEGDQVIATDLGGNG